MISFKQYINEAIALNQVTKTPGQQKVAVFMGRFQPPTKAHLSIIKQIEQHEHLPVVVAVVRGSKTSQNKSKNPFDFETQKAILRACLNNVKIIQVSTGFIGEFVDILRRENKEPVVLYCGSDRLSGYQQQVNRYKTQLNLNLVVKEIPRTETGISATKVRLALKNDDIEAFKKLTDKCEWQFFDLLKNKWRVENNEIDNKF